MIRFESIISVLKTLTIDFFLFFLNCVIKDTLINFLGVILFENVPKHRFLCDCETQLKDRW